MSSQDQKIMSKDPEYYIVYRNKKYVFISVAKRMLGINLSKFYYKLGSEIPFEELPNGYKVIPLDWIENKLKENGPI